MTYFPDRLFTEANGYAEAYFSGYGTASASIDPAQIGAAAEMIEAVIADDSTIYACGNGGSAAIANHLCCDCLKGIRTSTALKPRVASLSATVELITAIGNDIGYDDIFSFQLESLGRPGDLLMAISSSGSSPNIVKALNRAKEIGMRTIAMTGFTGGDAAKVADVSLHVDCQNYGVIEDVHQSLMHLLAQFVRHRNLNADQMLGAVKF